MSVPSDSLVRFVPFSSRYFQSGPKERKKSTLNKLFDPDNGNTVSQLLGLCSGNFGERKSEVQSSLQDDDFGLPSDLPCDDEPESENTQDFLNLCSGQFTTPACIDKNSEHRSNVSDLFDKEETDTSESQLMKMCSGAFANSGSEMDHEINRSAFEDSRSLGSLMQHFGKTNTGSLEGRKSFDNLFDGNKESRKDGIISKIDEGIRSEDEVSTAINGSNYNSNIEKDQDELKKGNSSCLSDFFRNRAG